MNFEAIDKRWRATVNYLYASVLLRGLVVAFVIDIDGLLAVLFVLFEDEAGGIITHDLEGSGSNGVRSHFPAIFFHCFVGNDCCIALSERIHKLRIGFDKL